MVYELTSRTKKIAKKLGVQIFASDNLKYKLEVYDHYGNFITYAGAANYKDYPTYLEMEARGETAPGFADKRRDAYWARHANEIEKLGEEWPGSRSYYAMMLLWS